MLQLRLNDEELEELDNLRKEMHQLQEKLNEMTHGEFYGSFASRGLVTFKVREIEHLLAKYPEIRDVLRECIVKHRKFYERYYGRPLTDTCFRNDEPIQNILNLQQYFPERFSLAKYAEMAKH